MMAKDVEETTTSASATGQGARKTQAATKQQTKRLRVDPARTAGWGRPRRQPTPLGHVGTCSALCGSLSSPARRKTISLRIKLPPAATLVWVDSAHPRPPRDVVRRQPAIPKGERRAFALPRFVHKSEAPRNCALDCLSVAWRLWIMIETIRRTRPMCGFVGSEFTSQTQIVHSRTEVLCPTLFCRPRLRCQSPVANTAIVSLRKMLRQPRSDHPQTEVRTGRTKAKEQKPKLLGQLQRRGSGPREQVQENRMFLGFGFELSHDVLLCADWGASTRRTLRIHRQIEITFPGLTSWALVNASAPVGREPPLFHTCDLP